MKKYTLGLILSSLIISSTGLKASCDVYSYTEAGGHWKASQMDLNQFRSDLTLGLEGKNYNVIVVNGSEEVPTGAVLLDIYVHRTKSNPKLRAYKTDIELMQLAAIQGDLNSTIAEGTSEYNGSSERIEIKRAGQSIDMAKKEFLTSLAKIRPCKRLLF